MFAYSLLYWYKYSAFGNGYVVLDTVFKGFFLVVKNIFELLTKHKKVKTRS